MLRIDTTTLSAAARLYVQASGRGVGVCPGVGRMLAVAKLHALNATVNEPA